MFSRQPRVSRVFLKNRDAHFQIHSVLPQYGNRVHDLRLHKFISVTICG
jgi:hypothetical protein